MVTLKIQSLDDIIRAYLCGLGFAGDKAAATIKQLKTKLTENGDGDAAVEALDHLLYQSARQIFKNSSLDKPQLIALLKFCYLRSNGAQKWGGSVFEPSAIDCKMAEQLHQEIIHVAPNYVLSHMEPQPIEIPQPGKLIKKIFKHKSK